MRGSFSEFFVSRGTPFFFLLLTLPALFSCRGPQARAVRGALARGDDQLLHRDYRGAIETFKAALAASDDRRLRLSAELGIGHAYLRLGHPTEALKHLRKAQQLQPTTSTPVALERAFGESHFALNDYSRASRHLEAVLRRRGSPERSKVRLLAAICAYKLNDRSRGEQHMRGVDLDADPELREILETHLPGYTGPRPPKPQVTRPHSPDTPDGPVRVLHRRKWHARPIGTNSTPMTRPYRVTVHHSGIDEPSRQSLDEAAQSIKSIQRFHQKERRWADIGYHYVVDRSGRIWQGREIHYQGAHARGNANIGNIGVVLLGNFTRQRINNAQQRGLERFLNHLCYKHGLPRSRVYTHAEILHGKTDCPGPEISRIIDNFRRRRVAMAGRSR